MLKKFWSLSNANANKNKNENKNENANENADANTSSSSWDTRRAACDHLVMQTLQELASLSSSHYLFDYLLEYLSIQLSNRRKSSSQGALKTATRRLTGSHLAVCISAGCARRRRRRIGEQPTRASGQKARLSFSHTLTERTSTTKGNQQRRKFNCHNRHTHTHSLSVAINILQSGR